MFSSLPENRKSAHPVLNYASLASPVVYHQHRAISLGELLQTVNYLCEKIPAHQHLLNLYEDRYYFLLGFLLGLKQQSISLFPSTVTTHVLNQLYANYNDLLILSDLKTDQEQSGKKYQSFDLKELLKDTDFRHTVAAETSSGSETSSDKETSSGKETSSNKEASSEKQSDQALLSFIPDIALNKRVAIIFTSGSTGQPKPFIKQWNDLLIPARHLTERLFLDQHKIEQKAEQKTDKTSEASPKKVLHALLATVPAQHMYGLEASIIVALQNGFVIHSSKPFFPQDITHCLEDLTQLAHRCGQTIETTVITTPLHLKACIKTGVPLPGVKQFISATAPLQIELAQLCETQYSARVMEIFGCTEVGSMACRRTIETEQWTVLEDITLQAINEHNEIQINTARSIKHFPFNDIIELLDEQHFILKGRKEDLINLAGKRTSLAYLNHHLQSYEELTDACFYQDALLKKSNKVNAITEYQLVAFVVLKTPAAMNNKHMLIKIRHYLQQRIESVFLPKKIFFVDTLPRNTTGKLPQSELKKLLQQQETK